MPPKKTAAAAKKSAAPAAHPSYQDMIKEAIMALKERNGSSRQTIKKYVLANNNLSSVSDGLFTAQFNKALKKGSDSGVFARPKGTSGTVKLAGPSKAAEAKPAATKTAAAAKAPIKAKATRTTTEATKKAPAKKVTAAKTKTTAAKKAPAKKATATKSKANTGKKVRKTPVAAPAVEEKAPVILGKTKSGRVTKSTAPQAIKATVTKKKVTAKRATPKKAAGKKA